MMGALATCHFTSSLNEVMCVLRGEITSLTVLQPACDF